MLTLVSRVVFWVVLDWSLVLNQWVQYKQTGNNTERPDKPPPPTLNKFIKVKGVGIPDLLDWEYLSLAKGNQTGSTHLPISAIY